jgi:tellurite methyltransferase
MKRGLPAGAAELIEHVRERFARELGPHFDVEERELFPLCEGDASLRSHVDRIASDHDGLRRILAELEPDPTLVARLDAFGLLLTEHVRYEERAWFPALEGALGPERLTALAARLRPLPAARIAGFEPDDEGQLIARLDCGHTQHMRHKPPWELRPWVATAAGRAEQVGTWVSCIWCRMPKLPDHAVEYKRTPDYDDQSTPAGLRKTHQLRPGTWGEIVVTAGRLLYVLEDEADLGFVLVPGKLGVVAPERPHRVEPERGTQFHVRFLREPG